MQPRVPEYVHLLLLPPYSPVLQPAEHRWPLTTTCPVNRHFEAIEDVEEAQIARCVDLQRRPELIRSATRFDRWPQRTKNNDRHPG